MTDIITPSFFEDSLFSEDIFMNTWSETNVEELNRSLERAMSPNSEETEIDRFGMGSPDSGIHVNSLEYDFNDALLGVDDPIFSDICSLPSTGTAVEVIPAEHPVIMSDFTSVNESFEEAMEEEQDDEEEAEDTGSNYSEEEEDEENQSSNIPKNHPVEIHSYSVIKLKREPGTFKKTTSRTPASRTKQASGGRKHSKVTNISQKKRKLYEMEPLVDPVAEKNRLNALNAKKNRDRKKQQLVEAEQEISRLREENEELRTEAEEVKDELESAHRELEQLRALLKQSNGGRHVVPGKARAHS